mgnify:CR=1 FL=1
MRKKTRPPESFELSQSEMWRPRKLKLYQLVFSDHINRLVKCQLPRSSHIGFQAFQEALFFFYIPFNQNLSVSSDCWFVIWTPFLWKNLLYTTICVTSDAKQSTALVLCLQRRVEWISTVEQCGVLGILCHTGGSLQEVLLALKINKVEAVSVLSHPWVGGTRSSTVMER